MSLPPATSYFFDPRPRFPCVSTVKRFVFAEEGLTLIYAHGSGFHKEQWEASIEDLMNIIQGDAKKRIKIREIWTVDAPNHGDAAILNEETLNWGFEPVWSWEEYARSIHAFITGLGSLRPLPSPVKNLDLVKSFEPFGDAIPHSFVDHRLVFVCHSMSAIATLAALDYFPSIRTHAAAIPSTPSSGDPTPVISSLILVEPIISNHEVAVLAGEALTKGSVARRDKWTSREDAWKALKERKTWARWDERVLKAFVDEGLRELPTLEYPEDKEGVTLKCTRRQETASYRDTRAMATIYRNFKLYVSRARVHWMYGEIHDAIPAKAKKDVIENAIGGAQNLASFAWIKGAGHGIPQTHPRACAERIFETLLMDAENDAKNGVQSKL